MSDNRQDVVEKAQTSPIEQERIVIFDTTMRDGEQSPGASMSLEEKLEIAIVLEEMGVDVIEAGFAIASKGDFEAITEVSKVIKNSVICSLARSTTGAGISSQLRSRAKPASVLEIGVWWMNSGAETIFSACAMAVKSL